ncbi:MAG: amino acid adenylation domain-containing protein [Lachnospiraceae bacterium]|nr:amino acid adenylation domain-containing protein [Lachnospiraceae bacterium]
MNQTHVCSYMEYWALTDPDRTAVVDENGSLTYGALKSACERVATGLAGRIGHGQPVAVLMEKGIPALCSFWGSVYAGGFYVMFNPDLPDARLAQIQSVLAAPCVITDAAHEERALALFAPEQVLRIEELLEATADPLLLARIRSRMIDTDPLYANFTSGSTGIPKGVLVSHRSVLDFIGQFSEIFGFTGEDIFANQAPFDFDVSVKDIYTSACVGGTLVITPKRLFSRPTELLDWLCDHRVTVMIWAVSALCLISTFHGLDYRTPQTVRKILFSGEVMPAKHLKTWRTHLPEAEYVNLYGPTEITCNCTYHVLDPARDYAEGIPIGKHFPNEHVFLLDADNREITVPDVEGEICVRGTALALGYLSAPEQTAAAFVQNPLNSCYPEIIYRTGDLARYNADGDLLFCGRRDHQIKYMGHRIELQEIDQAIARVDGVERCCSIFDEERHKLYAFYVGTIDRRELHQILRKDLPVFMVPGALEAVPDFPLTKNGKIDRKALLAGKEKKR